MTRALESLTNFHFNGFLLSKVYIVWTKKLQRIYLSWNWRGIQNLERKNWDKEFDKFWAEQSKVSKFFILMGFFWAKYILFKLQKYRGVIFHETEEGYKIWIIFTLIGFFWAKYILFKLKKYRGAIFHETEERHKIWRGIGLLFRNWH